MSHKFSDEATGETLRADALHDVERIVGKRWTEFTPEDEMLALKQAVRHNQAKERILRSRDDVSFGTPLPEYERVIADIGFRVVLEIPFQDYRDPSCCEVLRVWWYREPCIVLKYDTYDNQRTVNGGCFAYNWKPHDGLDWTTRCQCTSSCSPLGDGALAGSHDCREAVRYHIDQLKRHGTFIAPWKSAYVSFLSLWHYRDHKEAPEGLVERMNYLREIDRRRVTMLPADLLEATGWQRDIERKGDFVL